MADSGAVCLAARGASAAAFGRRRIPGLLVAGLAVVLSASAVARIDAQRTLPPVALAQNIRVGAFLEPCLSAMLERSRTFRETYAAVAHHRDVRVTIAFDLRSDVRGRRAETEVRRFSLGGRVAAIRLFTARDVVELIAHELEHVREQIEGVNLPLLAGIRSPGILRVGPNRFETERAVNVGLSVAGEVGRLTARLCVPEIRNAALIRQPF